MDKEIKKENEELEHNLLIKKMMRMGALSFCPDISSLGVLGVVWPELWNSEEPKYMNDNGTEEEEEENESYFSEEEE